MSENIAYTKIQIIVRTLLFGESTPTPETIRDHIQTYRAIHPISDLDAEQLARELETFFDVFMDVGSVLKDHSFEPWLDSARLDIDPYYWSRYKSLLIKQNFNNQVLGSLDEVTDRTLGLLQNPLKVGSWDRRGMVVGHVQSGKTANYTALACKAADAGYKLIIVIAGTHNSLRNQTQQRIDQGFVGRDSSNIAASSSERFIGVGKIDPRRRPVTFTTATKDFNKALAEAVGVSLKALKEPAVLVIKKNSSTLKNLLAWLEAHNASGSRKLVDIPMLLIDDEADNASINIKWGKDEVARINGQIRQLLNIFDQSCYVGYTATPFANIFIDPNTDDEMFNADLFPENFIVSLDPPTNYFGPTKVFIDEPKHFVRYIEDNEDLLPLKHKIDFFPTQLPESLLEAIRTFVLVRATRISRGEAASHNSMLINASRFTGVQERLRNEVQVYMGSLKDAIRVKGGLLFSSSRHDSDIADLFSTWSTEFKNGPEEWEDIYPHLHEAAAPINTVSVNSGSAGKLNYFEHEKSGLNVIAVGGFSLSRGLTLEGLSVSYFLRNSSMYDTLLQMGRWFGYRIGYEDLCRIWMPEEAAGWYAHIAEAVEELRTDLRNMERVGATPREFGLKVRSHPDSLLVTARNRMGSGKRLAVRIGLSNKFVETTTLRSDGAILERNREAVRLLVTDLEALGHGILGAEQDGGSLLMRSVPASAVMLFLSNFSNDPASLLSESGPIVNYIQERAAAELSHWDVLFVGVNDAPNARSRTNLLGRELICQQRTVGDRYSDNPRSLPIGNKQRVAGRGIEKTGLTDSQILEAKQEFDRTKHGGGKSLIARAVNYPDRIFRKKRDRPLLIIHILELTANLKPKDGGTSEIASWTDVIAWGISFPETNLDETLTEYIVNKTWIEEFLSDQDSDDDEEDDV